MEEKEGANMSIEEIVMVVTALVTLIFGELSKRFGWVKKKYIPYQNITIGIIAGLLVYFVGLQETILSSILTCLFASLCAGGAYDLSKTKVGEASDK